MPPGQWDVCERRASGVGGRGSGVRERESRQGRGCAGSEAIWVGISSAGLHTVSGNSRLQGKTPSIFPDTSSRHTIPVKVKITG